MRTLIVSILLAVVSTVSCGFDVQHQTGIVGRTQLNGNGCLCHGLSPSGSVMVWVQGPSSLQTGAVATYTIRATGGPAIAGGYNVAAFTGALSAMSGESQVLSGELTHTNPKAFANDTVSWTFAYQAPSGPGTDTLYAVAVSSNLDGMPPAPDAWNFGNKFAIQIIQTSMDVPALSEWAIVVLATLLILTTAHRLALRRHRSPT